MGLVVEGRTWTGIEDLDYGISAIVTLATADGVAVFAGTGYWGGLSGYALSPGGELRLVDTQAFGPDGGSGADVGLAVLDAGDGPVLAVGGLVANGPRAYGIDVSGHISDGHVIDATGAATASTLLQVGGGIVLADPRGDGLGLHHWGQDGDLVAIAAATDGATDYGFGIVDMAVLSSPRGDLVVTAAQGPSDAGRPAQSEAGITVWTTSANGLRSTGAIGAPDGLGLMVPTAIASVSLAGGDFVVVASAAGMSGALSVIQVTGDGALRPTDHVLDTRDTRFGAVQAMETIVIDGRAYVVAAGGDDGLALLTLTPDGRLIHLDSIEDTLDAGLGGVTALSLASVGGVLHVFAASQTEAGLTHVTFDPGAIGSDRTAGDGGGTLLGTDRDDRLFDGAGNDAIRGAGGDDMIFGGTGADAMTGGAGADRFIVAGDGIRDRIEDFEPGIDTLDLSGWAQFYDPRQLTILQNANGVRIRHRDEELDMRIDGGGYLDPAAVRAAILAVPTRIFSPPEGSRQGGDDDDILSGSWGADRLSGGGGDDRLDGGLGDDEIFGGDGTDTAVIGVRLDAATIERRADGAFVVTSDSGRDTYFGIEIFEFADRTLSAADLRAITEETDLEPGLTLTGDAGADTLAGGAGGDRLSGMGGDDLLDGGQSGDTLFGGDGSDRVSGGPGDDTLFGGDGADALFGNRDDDILFGGGGNDLLNGGGGSDRLSGGDGADTLRSGSGDDTLDGGRGDDRLDGGSGKDRIAGEEGADRLFGGSGDDWMSGNQQNDTLYGGTGFDMLYGNLDDDIIFGGAQGDMLNGGSGNDQIWGDDGNDRLIGGNGNDILNGGTSGDKLYGGSGADRLYGNRQHDALYGGSGADLLNGGSGRDRLWGDEGRDRLYGGTDRDMLSGGTADDRLYGGSGADRLFGNRDDDRLYGGDGKDLLNGGSGSDRLDGGTGDDTLKGGSGADSFVFSDGMDRDRIVDFAGNDTLVFDLDLVGDLDGAQIVDRFADVTDDGVLFDFGGGDTLLLAGVGSTDGLGDNVSVFG